MSFPLSLELPKYVDYYSNTFKIVEAPGGRLRGYLFDADTGKFRIANSVLGDFLLAHGEGGTFLLRSVRPEHQRLEPYPVINMIPHENRTIVIYRGELKFPGAGEVGDPALKVDGQRVPYDELDAWYRERMKFDWRGQPFHLERYRDGWVQGGYAGFDFVWASEQPELEGSGYEGFACDVPESEIENVRVEKIDLLEAWRYSKTFGVEPPDDLFRYVRPATDREWIKE